MNVIDVVHANLSKVIIAIIGLLFFSLVKTKFIKENTTKLLDKILLKIKGGTRTNVSEQSLSVTEKDILHHNIFSYINFWLESNIPSIVFFTDFRTVAFRKYLTIFFEVYQSKLKEYIKDGSYKTMGKAELKQSLIQLLTTIVFEYETNMSKQGLPPIIIKKMKHKNNETLNMILELINTICDSNFYETDENFLKIYSFLNIILVILENIISNSEIVCNNINGDLQGLIMDGFTEPSHK